ncbi:hypothetical protein SAMN05216378_4461 [Paenibacillus catalpae]|uniref:Uncharacterized protein n=1 Tax=Paenibacillus catalpae TaxID=1045775 RepID=A0A1I2E7Z3_9BACL|nr:hypothetical protein SAMN05216378_4461 [Paenibacillus catalpae]
MPFPFKQPVPVPQAVCLIRFDQLVQLFRIRNHIRLLIRAHATIQRDIVQLAGLLQPLQGFRKTASLRAFV